jgi:hypothetical protein
MNLIKGGLAMISGDYRRLLSHRRRRSRGRCRAGTGWRWCSAADEKRVESCHAPWQ